MTPKPAPDKELSLDAEIVLRIIATSEAWGFDATSQKAIAQAFDIFEPFINQLLSDQRSSLIEEFLSIVGADEPEVDVKVTYNNSGTEIDEYYQPEIKRRNLFRTQIRASIKSKLKEK